MSSLPTAASVSRSAASQAASGCQRLGHVGLLAGGAPLVELLRRVRHHQRCRFHERVCPRNRDEYLSGGVIHHGADEGDAQARRIGHVRHPGNEGTLPSTLGVFAAGAATLTRREQPGNEGILPSFPGCSMRASAVDSLVGTRSSLICTQQETNFPTNRLYLPQFARMSVLYCGSPGTI